MKIAVVTGASSGIGYELANLLSKKGIIVYGIAKEILKNENVTNIIADVTRIEEIEKIFKDIYEKHGRIDYLVNCAGMGISGSVEGTSLNDFDLIFNVNLKGTFITTKIVLPYMREKKKGRIINIGSVAGEFTIPFQTFYSSSKAAIKAFSNGLANEVAPFNIQVTTILPGDVKTNFTKNRRKNLDELKIYQKRFEKSIGVMEKDEKSGMSTKYVSMIIYKTMMRKKAPLVKTIGFKYKIFVFLKRFFTEKLINKVVGKIYGFKKEKE